MLEPGVDTIEGFLLLRVTAGESFDGLVGEVAGDASGVSNLLTLSFTVVVDRISLISDVIFAFDELADATSDATRTGEGKGVGLDWCGSLTGPGRVRL